MALSLSFGGIAAVAFFAVFVAFVFSLHDAQGGIGVVISPFLASWVGISVGFIVRGWQILRPLKEKTELTEESNEENKLAGFGLLYLILGFIGIVVIALWLWSEGYQATHPTKN